MTTAPLRSWLYVPAHDERKLVRAAVSGADVVILDLEDGVPSSRKEAARQLASEVLRSASFGLSRRFVRINSLASNHWAGDAAAACEAGADGLVVPKASVAADIARLGAFVTDVAGADPPALAVIGTEDARGALAMGQTVRAHALVNALLWGSEDLSASIGAWRVKDTASEFLDVFRLVRAMTVLEAAAAGVPAVDTPFLTIGDRDGLAREAQAAAEMGFAGKQAIHPEQIEVINAAFTPDLELVAESRHLIAAFERDGDAVVRVDDQMADSPHLLRARRVVALAEALASPSPSRGH